MGFNECLDMTVEAQSHDWFRCLRKRRAIIQEGKYMRR